jgi:hypothetical protein
MAEFKAIPRPPKENCSEEEASSEISVPAKISLPCPIWGLVSLLILIEGLPLKRWFRSDFSDSHPSLPVQTLEVRQIKLFALHNPSWAFLLAVSGQNAAAQRLNGFERMVIINTTRVQAATFMGCEEMRQQLLKWLQQGLKDVVQHSQDAASDLLGASMRMQEACAHIWHSTMVLTS